MWSGIGPFGPSRPRKFTESFAGGLSGRTKFCEGGRRKGQRGHLAEAEESSRGLNDFPIARLGREPVFNEPKRAKKVERERLGGKPVD